MIRIDTEQLKKIIKEKFGSYVAVQEASGGKITARTIYNLIEGQGWRSETVNVLCEVLGVNPAEIILFDDGDEAHTQVTPRSTQVVEGLANR